MTPSSPTRWRRAYQVCQLSTCHNWIWQDRVRCLPTVRDSWSKPPQGFAPRSPTPRVQTRSVTPPPALWKGSTNRSTKVQKLTGEILASSWDKLDPGLQQKLTEIGVTPPAPTPEPDLQEVLRDNLAQLPAPVKELVEKITKPQPTTEKDVANKLKQQVSTLRDLSHRKQTLQNKIDATKKSYWTR